MLCDVLMLYNLASVRSEPALQTLVYLPSDSLRSELAAFLLDYVFNDAEDEELTGTFSNSQVPSFSFFFLSVINHLYIFLDSLIPLSVNFTFLCLCRRGGKREENPSSEEAKPFRWLLQVGHLWGVGSFCCHRCLQALQQGVRNIRDQGQ